MKPEATQSGKICPVILYDYDGNPHEFQKPKECERDYGKLLINLYAAINHSKSVHSKEDLIRQTLEKEQALAG